LLAPCAEPLLNAGEIAFFRSSGKAGSDGIEIHVDHAGGNSGVIEEGLAFEARLPETALDAIFFVCSPCDEFIEACHEPAEAGQSLAQLFDTLGTADERLDLQFGRREGFPGQWVAMWEEGEPADGDVTTGPGGDEVRDESQDEVVVVFENGVGTDVNGEDGGQELQSGEQQDLTV